jgi:acetyl-CoA carboxylase biotin carboxyl carrier protein
VTSSIEGRLHARRLVASAGEIPGGLIAIASPAVGAWHAAVAIGAVIRGGDRLGELEILGASVEVVAPVGAHGVVIEGAAGGRATAPVGYGAALFVVDPRGASIEAQAEVSPASVSGGLVFASPISGRFFARPAPGKPPFVTVGATITEGQTVCMLEVMKTFNRVTYGGAGLPERARVVAILVDDEADVTMGQAILQLEAASE